MWVINKDKFNKIDIKKNISRGNDLKTNIADNYNRNEFDPH